MDAVVVALVVALLSEAPEPESAGPPQPESQGAAARATRIPS